MNSRLENHRVLITVAGSEVHALNKKTGQSLYAWDKWNKGSWLISPRYLRKFSKEKIEMQIDLSEEDPNECYDLSLWGFSTDQLREELELRKKEKDVVFTGKAVEVREELCKRLGLPKYNSLKRTKPAKPPVIEILTKE